MSSSKQKKQNIYKEICSYIFVLIVMILTSFNIYLFLKPNKILGASTTYTNGNNLKSVFWKNFLLKNPNYIPGLIENGDIQKASEIDPNFLTP